MISLADYREKYQFIDLSRDAAGILTIRFHTKGGHFLWGFPQHEEVADCLLNVSRDRENKIVIITGTGEVFLDVEELSVPPDANFQEFCAKHLSVGHRLIQNHLDIEVPMIAVVNGPAGVHAELAVLCDIVLAAPDAYFADMPHFPAGIVPGDGVHIIWPELLGINRGRYFLLMGEKIGAAEAKRLGIVNEILPREKLLERAREIAQNLARHDRLMLRHTRTLLVQKLRKQVADLLPLGLHAAFGAAMAQASLNAVAAEKN